MTRAQRRTHLLIWLLLAPLAIAGVALLVLNSPPPAPHAEPTP